MSNYFFAEDGSYGWSGDSPLIVDTRMWSLADWEEIENCLASERQFVARGIASKYASY